MCLAAPGKVVKIKGREAVVEYVLENGKVLRRRAMIGERNARVGDYVIVQMGIIVEMSAKVEQIQGGQ